MLSYLMSVLFAIVAIMAILEDEPEECALWIIASAIFRFTAIFVDRMKLRKQ